MDFFYVFNFILQFTKIFLDRFNGILSPLTRYNQFSTSERGTKMDRYAARLLLTAVMFGAVAVSATLFSDALAQGAGSEPLPVPASRETERKETQTESNELPSYYVSVQAEGGSGFVTVLDEDGSAVGNWETEEDGDAVIGPLAPGIYYAKGNHTGYAQILLEDNAAISVQAGCGWADGERLYLTSYEPSRLELTCILPEGAENIGIVTLELLRSDGKRLEQTGWQENGKVSVVFDGLRQGTYDILLHGTVLRTTAVDGRTSLALTLPLT